MSTSCPHPPKTDIRENLIQAGLKLLSRKGYGATSVNDVVALAGVPKGSFYYYYKSKEAFVEAVLLSYSQYKKDLMAHHMENTAISPLNRLRCFLAGGIRCMQADNFETGCLIGHLAQEIAATSPHLRELLNEITQHWHQTHREIFEAALAAGELPPHTNINALVETYFMLIQGAMMESKITKSLRGFQNAHWLIFQQIGAPAHALDDETEALLALS